MIRYKNSNLCLLNNFDMIKIINLVTRVEVMILNFPESFYEILEESFLRIHMSFQSFLELFKSFNKKCLILQNILLQYFKKALLKFQESFYTRT